MPSGPATGAATPGKAGPSCGVAARRDQARQRSRLPGHAVGGRRRGAARSELDAPVRDAG
ncbi:protein of unassigned function [Methylobacterium oryzae CBMB20]|uniref:Protein of unassigned function n=1 Tax=Methylobacterium oryzae CBMB20 TaxID=693986 RepID=A0A089NUD5_9HYPH|nr:protein of unassigned function [Methylobacterium oryzae CBMB20]